MNKNHGTVLTSSIVAHANVVADHVRHGSSQQVKLVRVHINADADRLRRADSVWYWHASFPTSKLLSSVVIKIKLEQTF